MEQLFLKAFEMSPVIAILGAMYYYQRKDYTKLVEDTRKESKEREEKMQGTISKNQDIIGELANKLNVVQEVKEDVEQIKTYIFK